MPLDEAPIGAHWQQELDRLKCASSPLAAYHSEPLDRLRFLPTPDSLTDTDESSPDDDDDDDNRPPSKAVGEHLFRRVPFAATGTLRAVQLKHPLRAATSGPCCYRRIYNNFALHYWAQHCRQRRQRQRRVEVGKLGEGGAATTTMGRPADREREEVAPRSRFADRERNNWRTHGGSQYCRNFHPTLSFVVHLSTASAAADDDDDDGDDAYDDDEIQFHIQ